MIYQNNTLTIFIDILEKVTIKEKEMIQTKTISSMTSAVSFDDKINRSLKDLQDNGHKIVDVKLTASVWFYYVGMIMYE